jgi:hypothetical protein
MTVRWSERATISSIRSAGNVRAIRVSGVAHAFPRSPVLLRGAMASPYVRCLIDYLLKGRISRVQLGNDQNQNHVHPRDVP